MGQEFGNGFAECHWLKVSHEVQSSCQLGLQSSEDMIGAGGSTCKMARWHSCWQVTSVPCHRVAWISSWHSCWLPPEQSKRNQGQLTLKNDLLGPSLGSDITSPLPHSIDHTDQPDTVWEGMTRGRVDQELELIGGRLGLAPMYDDIPISLV